MIRLFGAIRDVLDARHLRRIIARQAAELDDLRYQCRQLRQRLGVEAELRQQLSDQRLRNVCLEQQLKDAWKEDR